MFSVREKQHCANLQIKKVVEGGEGYCTSLSGTQPIIRSVQAVLPFTLTPPIIQIKIAILTKARVSIVKYFLTTFNQKQEMCNSFNP